MARPGLFRLEVMLLTPGLSEYLLKHIGLWVSFWGVICDLRAMFVTL